MAEKQLNVKNIPPALLIDAKIKAIREGLTLSQVIREFLEKWVKGKEPTPTK